MLAVIRNLSWSSLDNLNVVSSFGLGFLTAWWPQPPAMEAPSPTADCAERTMWKPYQVFW